MAISHHLPWPVTVGAKIILSHLPISRRTWKRMGLFDFGSMEKPEYAFAVFRRHFDAAEFSNKRGGFACLELGPGHSLSTALIAFAMGASQSYLVDVGAFALPDLAIYRKMTAYLRQNGLAAADLSRAQNADQLLSACRGKYLTHGLDSLREIPSGSVDFVFSHATLQMVRREQFLPTLNELRRIQRTGGAGSHCINVHDLMGGAANDLRFSSRVWESRRMANAGFYTNRIRYAEMFRLFKEAGFKPEVSRVVRWDKSPIPRKSLAPEFSQLSDDDLLTYAWDVVLR